MAASQRASDPPRLIVVMGVAGCGKSTVAAALARQFDATCIDADALHPERNIRKMESGTPLTDDDRWPWLDRVGRAMRDTAGPVACACSALRRAYRDRLRARAGEPVFFAYLDGSPELIASRMGQRSGHFMPMSLLESQFATLERPGRDEDALSVDISGTTTEAVAQILRHFRSEP